MLPRFGCAAPGVAALLVVGPDFMKSGGRSSAAIVVIALLVSAGCGGQAAHSDHDPGAAATAGDASALSGMPSSAGVTTGGSGEWGDIPIPETCVTMSGVTYFSDACELQVDCGGDQLVADCWPVGGEYTCSCGAFEYLLSGVTKLSDACPYAIAACLHSLPFETAPASCGSFYEDMNADYCSAESHCTSVGSLGQVTFIESHRRWADCSLVAAGLACHCFSPFYDFRRFEVAAQGLDSVCPDARDWCAGDGVELGGNRECAPDASPTVTPYGCYARVECKQTVLASGLAATMFDSVPVECGPGRDGSYECACPLHRFSVSAPDSGSACEAAADICAGRLMTQ